MKILLLLLCFLSTISAIAGTGTADSASFTVDTRYTLTLISSFNNQDNFGNPQVNKTKFLNGELAQWTSDSPIILDYGKRNYADNANASLVMTQNNTVTLNWATQYLLHLAVSDGGSLSQTSAWINSGTALSIIPSPANNYTFTSWNWTIPVSSPTSQNPLTLIMDKPYAIKAVFTANLTDIDSDGMPDAWETYYFSAHSALPDDDFDNDGLTNLEEYIKGTNPTRATTFFHKGWNLISTPWQTDDTLDITLQINSSDLLSTSVWTWNKTHYILLAYNQKGFESMQPLNGYWVYAFNDIYIDLPGNTYSNRTKNVYTGWNMAGPINDGLVDINFPIDNIWWYDGSIYSTSPNIFTRFYGYWLFSDVEQSITLP